MGKKARKTSNSSKSGSLQWAVGIAVVLVALLIGAQWWSNRQDARTITQAAAYYEQFPTQGTRIGSPDAPVHVEEYFDFQCPHCHTAAEQVVKRLLDSYVARARSSSPTGSSRSLGLSRCKPPGRPTAPWRWTPFGRTRSCSCPRRGPETAAPTAGTT